jgi:hypothetical protein
MSPSARTQTELLLNSASIHHRKNKLLDCAKNTHLRGPQAPSEFEIHRSGTPQPLHIPLSFSFPILFKENPNLSNTVVPKPKQKKTPNNKKREREKLPPKKPKKNAAKEIEV